MAITITPIGKTNPAHPTAPMVYYPKATATGEVDLETISEEIAQATSLTQADCYAVVISLAKALATHLEQGQIVRLEPLGTFQISVKGTGSETPEKVSKDNVTSASILFRPGKKLKKLLGTLSFVRKK
ncbi:HU family DNA-binding protein [Flavobacterium sp.]|uniref:HU family DNA-binding protein n=1 Tax=Flavobacterium sp. TaxID=239 RepID=UPI002FDAEE18